MRRLSIFNRTSLFERLVSPGLAAGPSRFPLHRKLKFRFIYVLASILTPAVIFSTAWSQPVLLDKKNLFHDNVPLKIEISTDIRQLNNHKDKPHPEKEIQAALIRIWTTDSAVMEQETEIRPRGDFRREECFLPPIRVNFKMDGQGPFRKLGSLKLVWPCDNSEYHEQLVLKEYLAYRIYNLLTERSFRVKLFQSSINDSRNKIKSRTWYGFLIEDIDDLAKRNGCREMDSVWCPSEQTDRAQTTLMSLFQYMIGNTDWGIPVYHNIKLIRSRTDSVLRPFAIPFDFDGSGLVNANYAVPDQVLGINSVRERVYRGFIRNLDEIQAALDVIRRQRSAIMALIRECPGLSQFNRKDMTDYVNEFYQLIADEDLVNNVFVKQARNSF